MQKTPGIYVEIRGNSSQLREELKKVKAETDQLSQDVSKALNNMFTPADVRKAVDSLANDLSRVQTLAKSASNDIFKGQSEAVDKFAKAINMAGKEYLDLQNKMLSNKAATSQEAALNRIAKAAGLTTREIQELGKQLGLTNKSAEAMLQSGIKTGLDSIALSLDKLKAASTGAGLAAVSTDLASAAKAANLTEKEFKELQDQIIKTANTKALESSLKSIATAAGMSAAQIDAFGTKMGASVKNIENVKTALGQIKPRANEATSALNMVGVAIGSAFGALASQAIGSVSQRVIEFARSVIDAGIAMDSLKMSYAAIFGGSTVAAQELEYVSKTADRLGQSFIDLAGSYRLYSAAAKGTSMSSAELKEGFEAITAASTALGLSTERTELIFKAFTQIMSKGQVMMEEVKNQLGDSLPGALDLFATAMGKSKSEFMDLAKEGKLLSDDVLPKVFTAMKQAYEQAAETAALETAQAAVNRLSTAWTNLKINLFDTEAFVSATNKLTALVEGIDSFIQSKGSLLDTFARMQSNNGILDVMFPTKALKDFFVEYGNSAKAANKEVTKSFTQTWQELESLNIQDANKFIAREKEKADAVKKANAETLLDFDRVSKTQMQKHNEDYAKYISAANGNAEKLIAIEKWHNAEVAKLQAAEDKRKEASLKKIATAENKAENDRKRAIEAYYNYIGNQADASTANQVANIQADRDKLLDQMAKNLSSHKDYEAMRQQIIAESARRVTAIADEEAAKREAAIDAYYDYVGSKAAGSDQNQIERERRKVDTVIEGLRQELGETEEFLKLKDALLKAYDKKATDIVEKGEKERSKIREEMEDEIFDAYATDLQKQARALDKYLKEQKKAYMEANASLIADGKKTTEEVASEFDALAVRYREAMEYANDPTIQAFKAAWDSAIERLDDAFLDLWDSFLEGGESTFDAFKSLFKNLLAELAHAAITKPIVLQLGTSMSNMLYGQGSPTEGVTGGLLSDLDLGSLFNLTGGGGSIVDSINAWGANTFSGLFAESAASTAAGLSSLAANTQSASASLAAAEASLSASSTTFMQALGGAAGIAGGLYQAFQGGTGNTVAGIGTGIAGAMAFTPAAPFAPLVAIGSQIAGSLFGEEEVHSPSVIFQEQLTKWGESSNLQFHTKDGADDEYGQQIADELSKIFESTYATVETMLDSLGEGYVSQLEEATVEWGRDKGGDGLWKEWDFGADMDINELMAKATADIQDSIFDAAQTAFEQAGDAIINSESATNALAMLGEESGAALQEMYDTIAAGVQNGDVLTYANQISALNQTISGIESVWEAVNDAVGTFTNPVSEYDAAVEGANATVDSWIASLEALGFSQEKIAEIEGKRAEIVSAATAEMETSFNQEMRLREAQLTGNKDLINETQLLISQEQELADVRKQFGEDSDQYAQTLEMQAQEYEDYINAIVEANEKALADELSTIQDAIDKYLNPESVSTYESEMDKVNGQFDEWIANLKELEATQEQLAEVEASRMDVLHALTEEYADALNATANSISESAWQLADFSEEYRKAIEEINADDLLSKSAKSSAEDLASAIGAPEIKDALEELFSSAFKLDYLPQGEGMASVYSAQSVLDYVSAYDSETGQYGEDLIAYERVTSQLESMMESGAISADAFASAVEEINKVLPEASGLIDDTAAAIARMLEASASVADKSLEAVDYYFGEISDYVDELNSTSGDVTASIHDMFVAMSGAFTEAAAVAKEAMETALHGYELDVYAPETYDPEHNAEKILEEAQKAYAEKMITVELAELVALAAEEAAGIVGTSSTTTQSDFAALLQGREEFSGNVNPYAALLDGLEQGDAESFLNAFYRISDALAEGTLNAEQFSVMFDVAKGVFTEGIFDPQPLADAWEEIVQASLEMITPPSEEELEGRAIGEQYDEWIATLTELGATQDQLAQIEADRVTVLANMAQRYDDAITAELSGMQTAIDQYITPLSDYAAEMEGINEQFDSWIDTLEELGATEEQLAQIEAGRVAVLEDLAAKQLEKIADEYASMQTAIDRYINPLSEYEAEIVSINEQFDQWIKTLEELGAVEEKLAGIEAGRTEVLAQLAANQAMAEAEEAVKLAETDLQNAYSAEVTALEKIISDHNAAIQAAESALQNAYTTEVSRLEGIISARDNRVNDARADLTAAYNEESSALKATSDRFTFLAKQLDDWISDFWSGSQSPLDMSGKTSLLYENFRTALEGALSGDESSFEDLTGSASDYLDAAKNNAATREDYARIAGSISSQMEAASGVAESQATVADQQLAALEAQVAGIAGLVEAQQTFADAFAEYQAAMADTSADDARVQLEQLESQMDALGLAKDQLSWTQALANYQEIANDDAATAAQAQLDAMEREYNAIMGVKDAVMTFGQALANLQQATAVYAGAATVAGNTAGANAANDKLTDTLRETVLNSVASSAAANGWDSTEQLKIISTADEAKLKTIAGAFGVSVYDPLRETVLNSVKASAAANGWDSTEQLKIISTADEAKLKTIAGAFGISGFASGGYHDGGLRIVGENGPELEYTGPSRIWNASDTRDILSGGGSQAELVAEIQQLRAEIRAANGAIARNTMDTAKLMRRWDGDGMPDTRAA